MKIEIPSKDELHTLRDVERKTREEIADKYGVSLSTVKRWIRLLEVPKKTNKKRQKIKIGIRGEIVAHIHDEKPLLEQAKDVLGNRLRICPIKGYVLDGFPCGVDKIIKAANLKYKDEQEKK